MNDSSMLVVMILVHVVVDFYIERKKQGPQRSDRLLSRARICWHSAVYGAGLGVALFALSDLGLIQVVLSSMTMAVLAGISSIAACVIKDRVNPLFLLLARQTLLVGAIALLWGSNHQIALAPIVSFILSKEFLLYLLAYLLVLKPVSTGIAVMLRPWTNEIKPSTSEVPDDAESLIAAGEAIGYLERALILTFVLLNQFTAIGFLLAAKSVFRFGDLKESKGKKLTEYVMLGTLASMLCTLIIGVGTLALSGRLG